MLRNILGAVAAYVAIVAVVMAGATIAWAILGGAGAFKGEGPEPSAIWMVFMVGFGFLAAVVGGWTALRIGRSTLAVKILVGLVLILGLYSALTAESRYGARIPVKKPVAQMEFVEAGAHARQPTWYNWVIPLIGGAGVLVGGRERRQSG